MASNAYRERLKSVAKDYAKLPHLKRQLNEKLVSSKINSIIYNDKKDFLIIEDSSSNNHVQLLKASNNGAVESWDGSGALEAVPGVTRSNYLNSTEVARFVSESDVKRAFGRKFKDIYKDTNLKVYGIRPGGMYSVGEDNIGRKVWCDVLVWHSFETFQPEPTTILVIGRDLYGQPIFGEYVLGYPPFVKIFCEERRYRYSGTLYSKLNSLINMMCYNKYFTARDLIGDNSEDNCYFITFRYDICEFVHQYARKLWENPTPISIGGEYYDNRFYYNIHPPI